MRLGVPMILAQLVGVLYNVVDRMFIGHLSESGPHALTGLGVVFPLISLWNAFANWAGQGGSSVFAIERGRGDDDYAERVQGNTCAILMLMAVFLMGIGYLFETPLLRLFGASPHTLPYASAYMRIYLIGTPFQLISLGLTPFISAQGFARTGMLSVVIGAIVNLALDPLFIFVLGLGVRGAALATVLAQIVSAAWVLVFLTGRRPPERLTRRALQPKIRIMTRVLALGFANFIFQMTNSVTQAVSNSTLLAYGGDLQVGVMTVVAAVRQIFSMQTAGFTAAAKPVISYNYGADEPGRVLEGIRILLLTCGPFNLAASLLVFALPGTIMRMFTPDPALLAAGRNDLRIYFACFIFLTLQMVGQTTFTALGMARHATFFSLFRKVVLLLPLTILLPRIPALGVHGVYVAEALSQLIGGTTCFIVMMLTAGRTMRQRLAEKRADL